MLLVLIQVLNCINYNLENFKLIETNNLKYDNLLVKYNDLKNKMIRIENDNSILIKENQDLKNDLIELFPKLFYGRLILGNIKYNEHRDLIIHILSFR